MTKFKSLCLKASVALTGIGLPIVAWAQTVESPFNRGLKDINAVGTKAGLTTGTPTSLQNIVGNIINVALGFLGILLLVYLIYAGFLWMTAGGEEKKTEDAKKIIKNAIIGLIIIVAAYAISNFVLGSLVNVTTR